MPDKKKSLFSTILKVAVFLLIVLAKKEKVGGVVGDVAKDLDPDAINDLIDGNDNQ